MRLFKHLKQIVSIVALGIALIFIIGCAYSQSQNPQIAQTPNIFTWEGELDPNKFDKWKVINAQPMTKEYAWIFVQNPDPISPIKVVHMTVDKDMRLLSYQYFKNGEPYRYVFTYGENKYKRHHFTQEERNSCMKCHSDKVVPQQEV